MSGRALVSLVLAVLFVVQVAGAQELSPEVTKRPRLQVYAAEFAAGLGGFIGAAVVGGGLYFGGAALVLLGIMLVMFQHNPLGLLGFLAGGPMMSVGFTAGLGSPFGGSYAVYAVGNKWHEGGTLTGATVGMLVGLVPGAGIVYLGYYGSRDLGVLNGWPFYAAGAVCVAAGATIGYNLSIPKVTVTGQPGDRLQPPGVTFTSVELPDHSVAYGVKVQLAGLRF
jgi:hypothetical protein